MQLLRWLLTSILLSLSLSLSAGDSAPAVPAATEKATTVPSAPVEAKSVQAEKTSPLAKGKTLHEDNCGSCHTAKNPQNPTWLYTREERKVTSYEGLKTQIQRCVTQLDLLWFEEDVANVATYLNTDYYHFELNPPK